ncbi:hypothetical protein SFC79_18725 [Nocardioides sp. S-58]|uniref:Peptidase MA-like domain-containing protein n=1 Tax=Nocardioides renjunii TaxID=3095075 RepID=A0ABU5KG44_9ACTN|nr:MULTISPECIES: hypothetical protein [unclassified Nocardioides]MDZ5663818.1 hypothetical protein [Nocardioides sp. S-58]WQQ20899.1 hypothetical protein SHK17_13405 [Nocardioides sp. S-34]
MVVTTIGVLVPARDGRHDVDPAAVGRVGGEAWRASPAEAADALARFVDGVVARDVGTLVDLAPPQDRAAEALLAGIAANARSLDLRAVGARHVDQVGTVGADGAWTGTVELTWRVGALDPSPSRAEVAVRFVPAGDGLAIGGFGPHGAAADGRLPLWLRDELAVARARDVLVMLDGDRPQARAEARAVARRVVRGIGVVERVLPGRTGPVVVEVPSSAADLEEALGARPGTYAGTAAVTAAPGTSMDDDAPVHVFLNPEITSMLGRAGAQAVMSHELVHLVTDAARTPVEPWLLEGFADHVALRAVLPDRTTLRRLLAEVRRDGAPRALPTAADFDAPGGALQASYEAAWLACRIIAERLGEQALVEVYDGAARGVPVERALARAGLPLAELTAAWRGELTALAR